MTAAAPYPADTRAKGWRFELDHERIRQSDTWALATPEVRPWLLMLWMVAWEQAPCGSMPSEPELIAARIGMPLRTFVKHQAVLLRGWKGAGDGRLYHPVLTERVRELLDYRDAAAKRKAEWRARNDAERAVHRESPVSHTGQTVDSHVQNATGTGTGTGTVLEKEKEKNTRASALPCPEDVDGQVWKDWLSLRKSKKAPVTETTIVGARGEAEKAAMPFEAFLRVWCARGSQGLEASWLKQHERAGPAVVRSFRERDADVAAARIHEMTGGLLGKRPETANEGVIDVFDTTARRLG